MNPVKPWVRWAYYGIVLLLFWGVGLLYLREWISRDRSFEIRILHSDLVRIDSENVSIRMLCRHVQRKYNHGFERVVISGADDEENRVFFRVFDRCSEVGYSLYDIETDGMRIPVHVASFEEYPHFRSERAHGIRLILTKEDWILNGAPIRKEQFREYLEGQLVPEKTFLAIECTRDSSARALREALKAYTLCGGKTIFIALW